MAKSNYWDMIYYISYLNTHVYIYIYYSIYTFIIIQLFRVTLVQQYDSTHTNGDFGPTMDHDLD